MTPLTYGSVFTGIAGFDLAFDRTGMECRWQVEIDEQCHRVLGRRFPTNRQRLTHPDGRCSQMIRANRTGLCIDHASCGKSSQRKLSQIHLEPSTAIWKG